MHQTYVPALSRRYELVGLIGSGGMGSVHETFDRLSNQSVALKSLAFDPELLNQLSAAGTDLRLLLAREYALLATLRHPHIISVYDFGFDAHGQPFFTMELLRAARSIVEVGHRLTAEAQEALLVQMLQALSYLHRYNVLHRDLKPDNVLVTPDGVVRLLDFGLASAHQLSAAASSWGSLPYMAPELLDGGTTDVRSDLYALGLITYEMITGKYPFGLDGSMDQLLADIRGQELELEQLSVTPALQTVLRHLLAKAPADRYASADAALEAYARLNSKRATGETPAIRESFLQASKLIGRSEEIERLTSALDAMVSGHGSAWLIGGESGVGKTRLLAELRTLALVRGVLVLRGQATTEAGTSFRFWRDALRHLVLLVDLDDFEAGVLKPILPDIDTLIGRPVAEAPEIEPVAAQDRLGNVVEAIILRYDAPLLLLLEDLQWLPEGLGIIQRLSKHAADRPLMLVGNYRDDERPTLTDELSNMQHLRLQRLSRAAIADLSASMLGEAGGRRGELVDFLMRQTEGNVFFLVETVRALAEEAGELRAISEVGTFMHVEAAGMQNIIQRRLNRIGGRDERLLHMAALMGRDLDLRILRRLDGGAPLDEWLTRCASVLTVQDDTWRFAHDKLREGALSAIAPDERRGLHHSIAAALEAEYGDDPDMLVRQAYHWGEAGVPDRELRYSAMAGEQLLRFGSYQEAYRLLRRALDLVSATAISRHAHAHVAYTLGKACVGLGNQPESTACMLLAQSILTSEYPNSDVDVQIAHLSGDELHLLTEIELELSYNYIELTTDPLLAVEYSAHAIALQERLNNPLDLANCYAMGAMAQTTIRQHETAARYADRAAELIAAVDEAVAPAEVAYTLSNLAYFWTFAARWDESFRDGERSAALYQRIGDLLRWRATLMNLAVAYEWRGNFTRGLEMRYQEYEVSRKGDNITGQIRALAGVGQMQAYLGRLEEARASLEQRGELIVRSHNLSSTRWTYLGMVYNRLGLVDEARAALPRAVEEIERIVIPTAHDMFSIPNTAEVLLDLWERDDEDVTVLQSYAPAVMRRIIEYGERYLSGEAHMLVIEGRYEWLVGRREHATTLWTRASEIAAERETPYAEALALYELGRHLPADDVERADLLSRAADLFRSMNTGYALSLVEQAQAQGNE